MSELQIRWLTRRDMPRVLEIEAASFEFPWCEEDFLCVLRERTTIGMVAEIGEQIVGFMIYELYKDRLSLLNFVVCPNCRREGYGSTMVARLKQKLSQQRRTTITARTRESNLPAQLFFRAQGFRAERVLRDYYDDTDEDCYEMAYRVFQMAPEVV